MTFALVLTRFAAVPAVAALAGAADAQQLLRPEAGAAIADYFRTDFGDLRSAELLNQIFGPLFPTAGGGSAATAFSTLIGILNLAVLAVGGLFLAYNITAGLLQSAHEGEMLGRRWSSLWAPLRVVFAAVLLMPMPGLGGYNAIQAGVAWIAKGSTMLASELWTHGARVILSGEIPLTGTAARLDGELFAAIYRNQLCLRLANYQFQAAGSPLRVRFEAAHSKDRPSIVSTIDGGRDEICGSYQLPETPSHIARLGSAAPTIEREFRDMHVSVLQGLIAAADEILAAQWPVLISQQGALPPIAADISAAMDSANQRLAAGGQALLSSVAGSVNGPGEARDQLENHITGAGCGKSPGAGSEPRCTGEGWIGAGNWHMTIARLNSEMMGLLNAAPTVRESRYISDETNRLNRQIVIVADAPSWLQRMFSGTDGNKYLHVEEAARIWDAATGHIERASLRLATSGITLSSNILQDAAPVGRSGLLGRIWQVGFADAINSMIESFSPANWADDPIVGVVRMGNWYLNVAGALIFSGGAASLLSSGFGTVAVFLVAAPLAAIGVTQSFILPMLPFFYWILAVAGYFLLVVEAVAAVSLWALAHLRLDGEGISGDAGRFGWLMLLGLTLTPALMVLGYFAGMTLFRVVAGLFDAGMFYAMSALATASPICGGLWADRCGVSDCACLCRDHRTQFFTDFSFSRTGAALGGFGGEPVRRRRRAQIQQRRRRNCILDRRRRVKSGSDGFAAASLIQRRRCPNAIGPGEADRQAR